MAPKENLAHLLQKKTFVFSYIMFRYRNNWWIKHVMKLTLQSSEGYKWGWSATIHPQLSLVCFPHLAPSQSPQNIPFHQPFSNLCSLPTYLSFGSSPSHALRSPPHLSERRLCKGCCFWKLNQVGDLSLFSCLVYSVDELLECGSRSWEGGLDGKGGWADRWVPRWHACSRRRRWSDLPEGVGGSAASVPIPWFGFLSTFLDVYSFFTVKWWFFFPVRESSMGVVVMRMKLWIVPVATTNHATVTIKLPRESSDKLDWLSVMCIC